MKIKILKHNVTSEATISDGIALTKFYLSTIGFPVEIIVEKVDSSKVFNSVATKNKDNLDVIMVDPNQILALVDGSDDIACLIYNPDKVTPKPTNPFQSPIHKKGCNPIQLPEDWFGRTDVRSFAQFLIHEITHATYFLEGKANIDNTHGFYTSQFSQVPDGTIPFYLSLLKSLSPFKNLARASMPTPNPILTRTYTWFNPKSDPLMIGVEPKLMVILDKVRDLAGIPIKITSGFRTKAQNDLAKGGKNSAHLRGLAIDFHCSDNTKRAVFTKAILNCGTPVFLEVAKGHIHIDIDSSIHKMGDMIVVDDD